MKFKITGIFYAGFLEYDTKLVFVDYYQAQRFFDQGDSVTGLELVVRDMDEAEAVARAIDKKLGEGPYRTVDWEELNKPLFTALKTQKLAFSVLLSIVVGVAAFNIIATLVMMVFDKRREIAILKSIGANRAALRRAILAEFITLGTVAGLLGGIFATLAGNIAAYRLFDLEPAINFALVGLGAAGGALLVGAAGYLMLRPLLEVTPVALFQESSAQS